MLGIVNASQRFGRKVPSSLMVRCLPREATVLQYRYLAYEHSADIGTESFLRVTKMSHPSHFLRFVTALVLAAAIWQIATSAQTATYYVRKGATGTANGSDWANAYLTLPTTLQRGATYYVATGSYGTH